MRIDFQQLSMPVIFHSCWESDFSPGGSQQWPPARGDRCSTFAPTACSQPLVSSRGPSGFHTLCSPHLTGRAVEEHSCDR